MGFAQDDDNYWHIALLYVSFDFNERNKYKDCCCRLAALMAAFPAIAFTVNIVLQGRKSSSIPPPFPPSFHCSV